MARSALSYLRLLQSLLPRGKAWNRDEGSILTEFLYGEAEEFACVDGRSNDLLREKDTRYTNELLLEHEEDLGLPDECSDPDATIQERRAEAHSRLITLGGQNPAYFIELAAALGWTVTITEYSPFICGVHGMLDACGDNVNFFYWKVTITIGGGNIIYFACGESECGDFLSYLPGTEALLCYFDKYKPAHTSLIWGFDGPEFDYAFGPGFDSMPSGTEAHLEGEFWREFGMGFDVHYGGEFGTDGFGEGFRKPV